MVEEMTMEKTGLMFFGQVSASISHEIKNVLAIINENAGLLEDVVLMAEKGVPPDMNRLGRLAETVRRQVRRADNIVRRMNQFAHSADHRMEEVDLYAAIGFMVGLGKRMIDMGRVSVNVIPPPEAVVIDSQRFYLQQMLWVCIESLMKASRPGAEINIHFERAAEGAMVRFCVDPAPDSRSLEDLFAGDTKALCDYLGLQAVSGLPPGETGIRLPARIQH